mgnify:CR=1 FL=1
MKIIISHPTGNQFVKFATKALLESNILDKYLTGIAVRESSTIVRVIKEFGRRGISKDLHVKTQGNPYRELGRHLFNKIGIAYLTRHEVGYFSVDQVYRQHDIFTSKHLDNQDAVYAYEDGALETFRKAKQLGIKTIYDLPIGYWRAGHEVYRHEREQYPEWASTLPGLLDSNEKLALKDEEIRLADVIVVASSFTKDTLEQCPISPKNITVIPYGFPFVDGERKYRKIKKGDKIKMLFVGGLSQRKGLAQLDKALEGLEEKIELTVIGRKTVQDCKALNQFVQKHNWIPSLPHHEILEQMKAHDVLVFPSLFEGFGLVITEAMSVGTPVITTLNTAGRDIIEHGENGWLCEAGSINDLKETFLEIIENPNLIQIRGKKALETARKRPWSVFGREIVESVQKSISDENGSN